MVNRTEPVNRIEPSSSVQNVDQDPYRFRNYIKPTVSLCMADNDVNRTSIAVSLAVHRMFSGQERDIIVCLTD